MRPAPTTPLPREEDPRDRTGRGVALAIAALCVAIAICVWALRADPQAAPVFPIASPPPGDEPLPPGGVRLRVDAQSSRMPDPAAADALAGGGWNLPPIAGVAIDIDGNPLPGVEVRSSAGWPSFAADAPAVTDAAGRFSIEPTDPGLRTIRCRSQRHVGRTWSGIQAGAFLEVVLIEGVPLAGRVVDERGRPIAGAVLRLDSPDVVSDDEGRFATVIPRPCLRVEVLASGYRPWSAAPLRADPAGRPLEIRLRRSPPGAPLFVRLIDAPSGQPIAAERIRFEPGPGRCIDPQVGLWEVTSRAAGVCYWYSPTILEQDVDESLDIAVEDALPLRVYRDRWQPHDIDHPIQLRVPRKVLVAGRVVDEAGNPLSGARITFLPALNQVELAVYLLEDPLTAITGSGGEFTCDRLLAGCRYDARVVHPHHLARTVGVAVPQQGALEIEPIHLLAGVRIAGTVQDEIAGTPLAGVIVRAPSAGATRTDAQGRFTLSALDPGGSVVFDCQGYASVTQRVEDLLGPSAVVVHLGRGVAIAGRVIDATGKPLRGVTVRCWKAATRTRQPSREVWSWGLDVFDRFENTAVDGTFRIDGLESAEYCVLAQLGRASSERMTVATGAAPIALVLRPPCGVAGVVRRAATGEPVSDSGFWFGNSIRLANAEGTFFIPATAGVPLDLTFQFKGLAAMTRHIVLAEGEVREWIVDLADEAVIEGVLREGDVPIAGAWLVAEPEHDDGRLSSQAETDEQGRFRIERLGGGLWHLRVKEAITRPRHGGAKQIPQVAPATLRVGSGEQRALDCQVIFP